MAYEKFTVKAVEAIAESQRIAGRLGNPEVRPGHLMLALLDQDKGIVPNLLRRIGSDPEALKRDTARVVDGYSKVHGGTKAGVSRPLQSALDHAEKIVVGDQAFKGTAFDAGQHTGDAFDAVGLRFGAGQGGQKHTG